MVRSDGFFLEESWPNGVHTLTFHGGDCPLCNNGIGPAEPDYSTGTFGVWHGPFVSLQQAGVKSSALADVTIRVFCQCIKTKS